MNSDIYLEALIRALEEDIGLVFEVSNPSKFKAEADAIRRMNPRFDPLRIDKLGKTQVIIHKKPEGDLPDV